MKNTVGRGMGLVLFLACAVTGALAGDQQVPAGGTPPTVPSLTSQDEHRTFMEQQRAARREFRRKLDQDRKAFNESLKGKSREEQKALRAQFQAKQKTERAAFHKEQHEKRRAFREAHPSEGRQHRPKPGKAPKSE